MLELLLPLLGDWLAIHLVALTIVVGSRGDETSAPISTFAIRSPLPVDPHQSVAWARF